MNEVWNQSWLTKEEVYTDLQTQKIATNFQIFQWKSWEYNNNNNN
jgi:hypothetical protein